MSGLLGVPHRLDGAGADHRGLPGPVQPPTWRRRGDWRRLSRYARVGVPAATGRCDEPEAIARRSFRIAAREQLEQPHLRGELQPAAPGRSGARQRQDHSRAGRHLPRRGLERHQGRCGASDWDPAAGERRQDGKLASNASWTKSSTASIQKYTVMPPDRLHPRTLLRYRSANCKSMVKNYSDEKAGKDATWRSRPGEGIRRLQAGGYGVDRQANRDSWPRRSKDTGIGEAGEGQATSPTI